MLVVGLTGGIGSGKTTVSNLFGNLNIAIVDADLIARKSVAIGSDALEKITAHFGETILLEDGNLNRPLLRKIVFDAEKEKNWLEQLLHPIVRQEIIAEIDISSTAYTILSSPLLLETDQHQLCSRILVIDVTKASQLQRASIRDDNSIQQIEKIIATQMPRDQGLLFADDVIDNNGSLESTKQQVLSLHQRYLREANQVI